MSKQKFVSLFNPGPREINAFEVGGEKITLLERQQKSYKSDLALRILDLFDFLQVREEFTLDDQTGARETIIGSNEREVQEDVIAHGAIEDLDEAPVEAPTGIVPEDTAICALCNREFQSIHGYRIHLKKAHNA